MMNNLGMGFVFTARDLASGKMRRLERRFSSLDERVNRGAARMTSAFRQLGVGLAVFTAGAVAVGGALILANAAGKFEQGLAAIGAVTQATTRQLEMLREAAISAGVETQFSPTEAIAGLQSLATAGQTATQATRTLVPVLDLAAGSLGQLGVAQAAEAVVGTLNAYGMAADQAAGVTDRLLRITQLTNFQTRDFETGLSKAAATGAVFNQSLDDVLITMGLLRNRNIDASSSATAFRESVRRVGSDARAQQAILGAGVQIFDKSSGRMRSMVDVMSDFAQATSGMTDAERNRRVVQAFGARGLLAFNAVMSASFTTMRDGSQVTLQGAQAIEALRHEMQGATGTAGRFKDKLLDTFEGQKTLLKGTMQTFAVVLGEPFAAIFKPIVRVLVNVLNAILRAFKAIPAPITKVFAGLVTAAGGFLMLVGGVIAGKAAFTLLVISFKAFGLSLGALFSALWPVVLTIGLATAAITGFVVAFQRNIGGVADAFGRVWGKIRLYFRALQQLFEQGGFSGAVMKELGLAENQGLKRFAIALYQIVYRIGRVWEGFKQGFVGALEAARPVFTDLGQAFEAMAHEVGLLFAELSGGAGYLPSIEFLSFGEVVGAVIGGAARWFTTLLAVFVRIIGGVARGFRGLMTFIKPALKVVGEALSRLAGAWQRLMGKTAEGTAMLGTSTSAWRVLGDYLGQAFGGVVTVITLALGGLIDTLTAVVQAVTWVKDAFISTGTWIGETAAKVVLWFTEALPTAISAGVGSVSRFFSAMGQFFVGIDRWFMGLFAHIADGIRGFLQPVVDFFRGIGRAIQQVFDGLHDYVIRLLRRIPDVVLPKNLERMARQPLSTEVRHVDQFEAIGRPPVSAEGASSPMPASAGARGRVGELAQLERNLLAFANTQAQERGQTPPFTVHVQVDGETIATAAHNANIDGAARAFSPVPSY